jgi:hypothetical protein
MHKIVRSEGPISKDEKTEQHNHALKRTSVKEYNRIFFYDNQDSVLDPFTGFTLLLTDFEYMVHFLFMYLSYFLSFPTINIIQ